MKRLLGLAALACLAAAPVRADTPPDRLAANAAAVRDQAMAGSGAYDILESLTTELGPRPAGSPAMARAKDWAIAKLTALGFSGVHAEEYPIWAWFKGVETAEVTAPFPQPLVITGLGGSVATTMDGVEGEVMLFKTFEDLKAAPANSLTGKIAVLTEKMGGIESPTGYGVANTWRRKGASEAAKRGAVGFMLRSLASDDMRRPHSGALNYDEAQPKIPAMALSGPDADQLERIATRGLPIRIKFTLLPTYMPQATTWNIVGEIKGEISPEEVVVVGGHLDSWGLGTGAVDDGAGVAIMTAAAKLAGAMHPRRTIRLVMFGAEETGQAGPAYARMHTGEVSRIVMAGESDSGAERVQAMQVPAGAADLPQVGALKAALAPIGVTFNPDPAKFGGDDIGGLYALGTPVMVMRQDVTHYFDLHHSADDTLDKVNPKALDQAAAAWAAAIYIAADSTVDLRTAPPAKP